MRTCSGVTWYFSTPFLTFLKSSTLCLHSYDVMFVDQTDIEKIIEPHKSQSILPFLLQMSQHEQICFKLLSKFENFLKTIKENLKYGIPKHRDVGGYGKKLISHDLFTF